MTPPDRLSGRERPPLAPTPSKDTRRARGRKLPRCWDLSVGNRSPKSKFTTTAVVLTCAVDDVEAPALDRGVRTERHVQATALRHDRVRDWSSRAAEPTNQRRRSVVAVVNLQSVVRTLQMRFQLEVGERLDSDGKTLTEKLLYIGCKRRPILDYRA